MAVDANWLSSQTVTQKASQVSETITSFVFYIPLSSIPHLWNTCRSDGGDIRVTESDGTTEVPIHLVSWDYSGKTCALFFKGTTDSVSDKDYIVHWNNAAATGYAPGATYGQYNVWTAYTRAYMLDEDSTAIDGMKNATENSYHGTFEEGGESGGGQVGGRLEKNATYLKADTIATTANNRIRFDNPSLRFEFPVTITAWVKPKTDFNRKVLLGDYATSTNNRRFFLDINNTLGLYAARFANGSTSPSTSWEAFGSGGEDYTVDDLENWYLWSTSIATNGLTCNHYKDNSNIGTGSLEQSLLYDNSTDNYIGAFSETGGISPYVASEFEIDTLLIANTEWSGNRVATHFANQNTPDLFWEIELPASGPRLLLMGVS